MSGSDCDPFRLSRFLEAQSRDYAAALREIRAGRKQTHWIWYVLPQLKGLGTSRMSETYGIESLEEARAYLAHEVLGPRLHACVTALCDLPNPSAEQILGPIDAVKFRSCLTLFREAAGTGSVFDLALERFFDGEPDGRTLELLKSG
jgi:uncharacterized protein (DUF1810 family)